MSPVEVITSVERRRHWNAEQKRALVEEAEQPGNSISSIARKYEIHPNHHIDREKDETRYHLFGQTKAGSVRYRCKACGRTFIGASSPTIRHRKPHKNAATFRLLVNKVPFRRICEIEGITMSALYRKIDFVHRQCITFAAERERNLSAMPLARLYIGVDRQDYMINWSDADDRRTGSTRIRNFSTGPTDMSGNITEGRSF